jgi:hypothetical protein
VETKTGGDELNGDRGAHNKPKTKRAGADGEKKGPQGHPRGIPLIGPGPPLGQSIRFTCIKPMFSLASLGCSKVLLGGSGGALGGPKAPPRGSWGTPWGARGRPWGALGGPWGSLGGPRGALREHFWKTGGFAKSLVLLHKMVHSGSPRGCWGNLREARSQQ